LNRRKNSFYRTQTLIRFPVAMSALVLPVLQRGGRGRDRWRQSRLPIPCGRTRRPVGMRRFAFRQWLRGGELLILRRRSGGCVLGHCRRRLGCLQLAVAGSIGIASSHTSDGLGGTAADGIPIGRGRLRGGVSSPALVRGNAQTHFLFPGRGRFGLDYSCAQDSSVPSEAPVRPVSEACGCCFGPQTPCIWSRRTLRSRKKGGHAKRTGTPPWLVRYGGRERGEEDTIFACCQSCAARLTGSRQPVLLC